MKGAAGSRSRLVLTTLIASFASLVLVGCSSSPTKQPASSSSKACLSGTLTYTFDDAENGGGPRTHPARNATWELRGATGPGTSAVLVATGTTSGNDGTFHACASSSTLTDASVTFASRSNALWQVIPRLDGAPYTFTTPGPVTVSGDQDLGTIAVPSPVAGAWKITDTLQGLYAKRATTSPCWTSHQSTVDNCHELTFVWAPDRTDGGYFDQGASNDVILAGTDPKSAHLIVHEAGHWFMWQLYGEWFPTITNCDPHYVDQPSSASCAWTEGFADAVAAYVLGDRHFVQPDGSETSMDGPAGKGGAAWPGGGQTQGNVGAALLDLWDLDGGWNQNIALMTDVTSNDLHDYFVTARPEDGLATDGAALALLATHGINY